ncbi:MAG: hypothetical protein WBN65_14935 [Gammaproteobacteria bacterium]
MNHLQRFSIDLARRESSRRASETDKSKDCEPGTNAESPDETKSGPGPLPPTRRKHRKAA